MTHKIDKIIREAQHGITIVWDPRKKVYMAQFNGTFVAAKKSSDAIIQAHARYHQNQRPSRPQETQGE